MHVLIGAGFWLPLTALLVAVVVQSRSAEIALISISVSLVFALLLVHRAQSNLTFPAMEVCDQHLVVNMPLSRRRVYNRDRVEGARFLWHIFYFRHMGWPVFIPLPRMPMDKRKQLLALLRSD